MKKIVCLLLAMSFAVFAAGCSSVEFEDTNGPDDYSLTQITDDNIVNLDVGAANYSQKPGSEESDNLSRMTEFKSDSFNGVAEIYRTHLLGKSDLTIDVSNLQVSGGNYRLSVVQDGEIIHDFPLNEMLQTYELRDTNGDISIVMSGESADFYMSIQVW